MNLQSLVEKPQQAYKVICPSWTFLWRLFKLLNALFRDMVAFFLEGYISIFGNLKHFNSIKFCDFYANMQIRAYLLVLVHLAECSVGVPQKLPNKLHCDKHCWSLQLPILVCLSCVVWEDIMNTHTDSTQGASFHSWKSTISAPYSAPEQVSQLIIALIKRFTYCFKCKGKKSVSPYMAKEKLYKRVANLGDLVRFWHKIFSVFELGSTYELKFAT